MASSDNRRRLVLTIVVRLLGAGARALFTVLLLTLGMWNSVAMGAGRSSPSPPVLVEHYVLVGAILSCFIASVVLVFGPLHALAWPRLARGPVLGYLPVWGFALAAVSPVALLLVEWFSFTEDFGLFALAIIPVPAALAALAWWLRR